MGGPYEAAHVDEFGVTESPSEDARNRRQLILYFLARKALMCAASIVIAVIVIVVYVSKLSGGEGTDAESNQAKDLPWWKNQSVYAVYLESYYDSDNDGYGDIRGLADKLPYIKDLGFKVVWLSLILYQDPMYIEHDVKDYFNTNWPTMANNLTAFDHLIQEIQKQDMKLIMDFELNHSSNKHIWFFDSEENKNGYDDFYVWRDAVNGREPNNWLCARGGSAWGYSDFKKKYYLQQLQKNVADLNFRNPTVLTNIKKAIEFWLDRGADGIHLTNTAYLIEDPSFENEETKQGLDPSKYNSLMHNRTKNRPESFTKIVEPIKNFVNDRKNVVALTIDSSLDDKQEALRSADLSFNSEIIEKLSHTSTCQDFRSVLSKIQDSYRDSWPTWLSGTWDVKRLKTRLGSSTEAFQVVQFLLPGTPVVYYGEEIGMEDVLISFDEAKDPFAREGGRDNYKAEISRDTYRTPMQWNGETNAGFSSRNVIFLPVHANYKEINVEKQTKDESSNLNRIKLLNKLHAEYLTSNTAEIVCDNDILRFERQENDQGIIVLANFGNRQALSLNFTAEKGPLQVILSTTRPLGGRFTHKDVLEVNRNEAMVLRYGKNNQIN